MNMKIDGQRIRALRLERSWSQESLAEQAGLSLRTIQRMETEGVASLQSRGAVAAALGVNVAELDQTAQLDSTGRAAAGSSFGQDREPVSFDPPDFRQPPARPASSHGRTLVALGSLVVAVAVAGLFWLGQNGGGSGGMDAARSEPRVVTVDYGNIENGFEATGVIWPGTVVPVGTRASGALEEVLVEVGDRVEEGQLLARLDAEEQLLELESIRLNLELVENRLEQSEIALQTANNNLRRIESLTSAGVEGEGSLEQAQAIVLDAQTARDNLRIESQRGHAELRRAEVQLNYTEVRSPIDGTVIAIDQRQGAILNASLASPTLMRVADLSRMMVEADVQEADVAVIQQGVLVHLTTLRANGRRWDAEVTGIDPMPKNTDGMILYRVRLAVDNADRSLFTGMTTQLVFETSSAENVLTVPLSAVSFADAAQRTGAATVEVVLPGGDTESREVVIGQIDRVSAEVVSGLTQGERVVARLSADSSAS